MDFLTAPQHGTMCDKPSMSYRNVSVKKTPPVLTLTRFCKNTEILEPTIMTKIQQVFSRPARFHMKWSIHRLFLSKKCCAVFSWSCHSPLISTQSIKCQIQCSEQKQKWTCFEDLDCLHHASQEWRETVLDFHWKHIELNESQTEITSADSAEEPSGPWSCRIFVFVCHFSAGLDFPAGMRHCWAAGVDVPLEDQNTARSFQFHRL